MESSSFILTSKIFPTESEMIALARVFCPIIYPIRLAVGEL